MTIGGDCRPSVDIPNYIRLAVNGKLNLRPLITDIFSTDDIKHALDKMKSGDIAGKCLLAVGHHTQHSTFN